MQRLYLPLLQPSAAVDHYHLQLPSHSVDCDPQAGLPQVRNREQTCCQTLNISRQAQVIDSRLKELLCAGGEELVIIGQTSTDYNLVLKSHLRNDFRKFFPILTLIRCLC